MERISNLALLTGLLIFCVASTALGYGYTVDGNLTDWGIDLSQATEAGYLDSHIPSGIDEIFTEDNAPVKGGFVGPGYSSGNDYDVEAMYADFEGGALYIAIVSGMPPGGRDFNGLHFGPGDIGIDVDVSAFATVRDTLYGTNASYVRSTPYELALDINATEGTARLVMVNEWSSVRYIEHGDDESGPYGVSAVSQVLGNDILFAYSQSAVNDHWVIEAAIPMDLLGLSEGDTVRLNWTVGCGNDYARLEAQAAPEPASLLLFGSGLLGLSGFIGRLRRRRT